MTFGRLERSAVAKPMSDINMTPLIDVMLVLLVIFMITAPLMASSLKLDLPQADAAQPVSAPEFIRVALNAQGQLFVDDLPVEVTTLEAQVRGLARQNPQAEVQLRADKNVPYGRVAELINLVQKAGLSRIGFVAEPVPAPGQPSP